MATYEKRVQSSTGKTSWRAKIRMGGYSLSETWPTKKEAQAWATQVEANIRSGTYVPEAERRAAASLIPTVEDTITRYTKSHHFTTLKDQSNPLRHLEWWVLRIGSLRIDQVTPAIISQQLEAIDRAPATVNRYYADISRVMGLCAGEWMLLEVNPASRVKKRKEPPGVVRWLDDDEREALFEECRRSRSSDLYPAVVVALSTGMRKSEQFEMRRGQVTFQGGYAYGRLEETKNSHRRAVPLVGEARDIMADRLLKVVRIGGGGGSDLVWPSPNDPRRPVSVREAFDHALGRAGIENFRWHDLRHTFASYLAMSGATLPEIAAAMGHRSLSMVQRYAHIGEQHTTNVVSKMAEFRGLMGKVFGNVA